MEYQQNQNEKQPDDKIIQLADFLKQKIQQRFAELKKESEKDNKKEKEEQAETPDPVADKTDGLIFES